MTITQIREQGNRLVSAIPKDVLAVLLVLFASTASFGLGMLSERERSSGKDTFWIEDVSTTTAKVLGASAALATGKMIETRAVGDTALPTASGKYLASKNGKKYYLPSCKGAKRIKEENKVWFTTLEEAQQSGRTAAANCPGL
jgi:hypothetical protein